jgi:hypothetical protein
VTSGWAETWLERSVTCPACKAAPFKDCTVRVTDVSDTAWDFANRQHKVRVDAAFNAAQAAGCAICGVAPIPLFGQRRVWPIACHEGNHAHALCQACARRSTDGWLGVCPATPEGRACLRAEETFSLGVDPS